MGSPGEGKLFANPQEVRVAYDTGEVGLQARIRVRMDREVVATTVGRVLLSEILPSEIGFNRVNRQMDKSSLTDLVAECYQRVGKRAYSPALRRSQGAGLLLCDPIWNVHWH